MTKKKNSLSGVGNTKKHQRILGEIYYHVRQKFENSTDLKRKNDEVLTEIDIDQISEKYADRKVYPLKHNYNFDVAISRNENIKVIFEMDYPSKKYGSFDKITDCLENIPEMTEAYLIEFLKDELRFNHWIKRDGFIEFNFSPFCDFLKCDISNYLEDIQ